MPRITINEVNSTQSMASDTTSASRIALIGTAKQGPISEPVLVNTYAEFLSIFGNVAPTNYPYGYYAAKECLYAGNPIIYARLADDNVAQYASYTLADTCILTNDGGTKGTYANGYKVTFTQNTTNTDVYAILVTDSNGNIIGSDNVTAYNTTSCTPTEAEIAAMDDNKGKTILGTIGGVKIEQFFTATTVENVTTYQGADLNVTALTSGAVLSGGNDGDNFSDSTILSHIISGQTGTITGMPYILSKLADDSVYNYILISAPGIGHLYTGSAGSQVYLWQTLSDLCNGTSVAGTSYEFADNKVCIIDSAPTTSSYTTVLSDLGKTSTTTAELQTAFFYPWYVGSIINQTGVYELPPSIAYLRAFALSQKDGYPCYPIAGPGFGSITRIADVDERLGRTLCEKVTDLGINPISYHRNLGYFFDGNVIYNPNGKTKTYQQLSIRQTINYIKQKLNELCYSLSYGLNVPIVRTQFQGSAVALLEKLKTFNFVYGYSVVINDNAEDYAEGKISATIKVFPTSALEEFVIDLTIVNTNEALS